MTGPVAPADSAALLEQAERAANTNDWNRAADLLADAGDEIRILDKRAFVLSRAKRYSEALDVLAVLLERDPDNFLWPHMIGYQHYEQERYAEAAPWLVEAYKRNPTHLRNLYRLSQTRRHLGDTQRARRAAAEVLRLWHELPPGSQEREARTMAKASYLLGRRDPHRALPLFEQAAAPRPGGP